MDIWLLIASFFAILIALTFINYKVNKEFKIETSWLALSLAPVVIWLLTTQQLSEFSGFGLAFKLKEASSMSVSLERDGNEIEPQQVSSDSKEGIGKIELLKRNRVAAITLELGRRDYYVNDAIQTYLTELTPLPFFKYVLFVSNTGEFRGIISGSELLEEMLGKRVDLVGAIESGNIASIANVSTIFVATGSSKQQSLQLMDKHGLSELPVVDQFSKFVGVVERNKITSSIVAQLVSSNR